MNIKQTKRLQNQEYYNTKLLLAGHQNSLSTIIRYMELNVA